ncbi:hypothetical protein [Escherichia coli]|uniref:hypothetical protein n=1 Tax=Escherichia coli TaxID=562 RepID=UPI0012FE3E9C|nr:hypothetical protein [Escherichia coli]EFN7975592.1 hypothetical protein [Escherichia coli]MVV97444.1 hypothetical protein [Escherichia coli]MWP11792.1 hypothetical protein [Escherichia coli]
MVAAVTHNEAEIRNEGILAERQAELEAVATNMPKPIPGRPPYLMEKSSGIIHPYSEGLAQRSDLVIACFNLQGSQNPADADPEYDPQGIAVAEERHRRLRDLPPENPAEIKASLADEITKMRAQMLEELELERAEMRADMKAEYESFKQELETARAAANSTVTETRQSSKKESKTSKKNTAAPKADVVDPETAVDAAIVGANNSFDAVLDGVLKDS